MCLTSDNKVFTWGLDIEGQLGHRPSGHRAVPTQVMGEIGELKVSNIACGIGPGGPGHTAAISDGKLYTWYPPESSFFFVASVDWHALKACQRTD